MLTIATMAVSLLCMAANSPSAKSVTRPAKDKVTSDASHRLYPDDGTPVDLESEYERALYGLGAQYGKRISRELIPRVFASQVEVKLFLRGLVDGIRGEAKVKGEYNQYESRLISLREPWKRKRYEKEAAVVVAARKQPGAVLLDKGVVFLLMQPGTQDLPASDSAQFVTRIKLYSSNGVLVQEQPTQTRLVRQIKEMPAWLQQAIARIRVGGRGKLILPPGVLDSGSTPLAEWESGVVELSLLDDKAN